MMVVKRDLLFQWGHFQVNHVKLQGWNHPFLQLGYNKTTTVGWGAWRTGVGSQGRVRAQQIKKKNNQEMYNLHPFETDKEHLKISWQRKTIRLPFRVKRPMFRCKLLVCWIEINHTNILHENDELEIRSC